MNINTEDPSAVYGPLVLRKRSEAGACVSQITNGDKHAEMDAYGKANGLTVVFAPWHPHPEYRRFKTGSCLSRNDEYPSGLVIVNERGVPHPWQA
jgi:hypothetical protein